MPVSEQVRVDTHTGNGITINFAYGFRIFADADLQVVVDGVLQTLTTDYTVNGADDPGGGSIDFITAPINLSVVTISGELPYDRETDYIDNGDMRAETVDNDFDKQVMLDQQLRRDVKRSIKLPIEETDDKEVSLTPANRALKVLSFDAAGLPTAQSIADLSSILSSVDTSLTLAASILSVAIPNREGVAGGTVDAITTTTVPAVGSLTNHLAIIVQAAGANTVVAPTFSPDGMTAKDIVKGSNEALVAGDIPGINYRMHLVFSAVLDKWVLLNPYGANAVKASIQSGGYLYGVGAGAVNVMTTTLTPTLLAYTDGMKVRVKVNLANTTTTPTLNIDGLGAKTIKREGGIALLVGDMPADHRAELEYDSTDFILKNPAQDDNDRYALETGAADAYVIAPSPAIAAYRTGLTVIFKVVNANATASPTLNVNGLGVKNIGKMGGTTTVGLNPGDMEAGAVVMLFYDGTNFILLNPSSKASALGGWATVNSAGGTPVYLDTDNVSGTITDNGVGKSTITWDRDFGNANYPVAVTPDPEGASLLYGMYRNRLVGSCDAWISQDGVGYADNDFSIMATGRLA